GAGGKDIADVEDSEIGAIVVPHDVVHVTGESGVSREEGGHAVGEPNHVAARLPRRKAEVVGGELGTEWIADFIRGRSIAVSRGYHSDLNAGLSCQVSECALGT